jgi:hypothetical protein
MTVGQRDLWGINAAAYLPAEWAWSTWALCGIALLPPIGRRLTRGLAWIGRRLEPPTRTPSLAFASIVALIVLGLPDRVGFTGDTLLRLSSAKATGWPSNLFPQAMPLDLWLHYTVPHEIARRHLLHVEETTRLLDALEAGALGWIALAIARRAGLLAAELAVAGLVIAFGTPLAIYTGLNKAFTELAVVTAAVVAVTWPGPVSFARTAATLACGAAAFALHRSGLILAPVVAFELMRGLRVSSAGEARWKRIVILALAAIATVLAAMALSPIGRVDLPSGLVWPLDATPSVSPMMRVFDLANLVVMLAPAALLVPALFLDARWRAGPRRNALAWAACLAIPGALLIALIDAPQGYFRDWDMFIAPALLLSILGVITIGLHLARTPRSRWLSAAVALSTVVPGVQFPMLQRDAAAGLARIAALADSPHRSAAQRASVFAFLGQRAWDRSDWSEAAAYARRATELVSSRLMLTLWAEAEQQQGRHAEAEMVFERLVATAPDYSRGWIGLAGVYLDTGRPREAVVAAERAMTIEPTSERAARILEMARSNIPR